jgi:hypothetical protein
VDIIKMTWIERTIELKDEFRSPQLTNWKLELNTEKRRQERFAFTSVHLYLQAPTAAAAK